MRIVFWQNMPCHHQSPFISALASEPGCSVWVALESGVPEWRRRMGWEMPEYGVASIEVGLTPDRVRRVSLAAGPGAVHVFSGLGAYPGVEMAMRWCVREGRRVGLMAESSQSHGVRGAARILVGNLRRLRYGRSVEFVLAIGTGATRWFQRLGFPEESVFEFAYFPPAPLDFAAPFENVWPPDTVRLLYVGQLIRRKGIDFLLDALAGIDGDSWHLDLVGTGSEEPELRRLSEELGISNRVTFLGPMSNANAMAVINTADTLVLASRFDGYGAVVNEALLRGVPVICSTNCGARQAITGPELGTVFHSGSVQSLRDAIRNWLARGPQTEAMKAARRLLAAGLSPHAGAAYFLNILRYVYGQGPRPIPPWQCDRTRSGDGFSAVRD